MEPADFRLNRGVLQSGPVKIRTEPSNSANEPEVPSAMGSNRHLMPLPRSRVAEIVRALPAFAALPEQAGIDLIEGGELIAHDCSSSSSPRATRATTHWSWSRARP
jgi:hypothetical protein